MDVRSSTETKSSGWAIALEASTLGLGASVIKKIVPAVNARVGVNGFSLGRDIEDTDITYEDDLNLFNVTTGLDFYPLIYLLMFLMNCKTNSIEPHGRKKKTLRTI
jgi:hypothetical protein